jgi:hypothetical protein
MGNSIPLYHNKTSGARTAKWPKKLGMAMPIMRIFKWGRNYFLKYLKIN